MDRDDKGFYMGWGLTAALLGMALVAYFFLEDAAGVAGMFFLGLGAMLAILGVMGRKRSTALMGLGAVLGLLGLVITALRGGIAPLLVAGFVLLAVGLGIAAVGLMAPASGGK